MLVYFIKAKRHDKLHCSLHQACIYHVFYIQIDRYIDRCVYVEGDYSPVRPDIKHLPSLLTCFSFFLFIFRRLRLSPKGVWIWISQRKNRGESMPWGVTLVIFHYIDFLLGFEALIQSQYLTYGSFILSFLSFFKYIYIWETFKQTKQVKCNIVYLIMSDTRLYTVELPD